MYNKPKKNEKANQSEEYINYIEPIVGFFAPKYENKPWTVARGHSIAIVVAGALVTAGIYFAEKFVGLPNLEWLYIILGLLGGFALFITSYHASVGYVKNRKKTDPNYFSLKERFSPKKRLTNGIFLFIILLAGGGIIFSTLPKLGGGILLIAGLLGVYAFCVRTPEEYARYQEGEIDPRDMEGMPVEEDDANDANDETEGMTPEQLVRMQEYFELIEKLPPEQQEVLRNDTNSMNAFINHDKK